MKRGQTKRSEEVEEARSPHMAQFFSSCGFAEKKGHKRGSRFSQEGTLDQKESPCLSLGVTLLAGWGGRHVRWTVLGGGQYCRCSRTDMRSPCLRRHPEGQRLGAEGRVSCRLPVSPEVRHSSLFFLETPVGGTMPDGCCSLEPHLQAVQVLMEAWCGV